MNIPTDHTDTNPRHFWLSGEQPERVIEFDEEIGAWQVYGHAETLRILSDPKTYSSDMMSLFAETGMVDVAETGLTVEDMMAGNLVQMDPPDHRKLRSLVSSAFTPKVVADLEPRIAELTHQLLAQTGSGEIELVRDLAYPLPVTVIADLLGVPASDHDKFREWAKAMGENKNEISLNGMTDEQKRDMAEQFDGARKMAEYIAGHAAERRRQPREDLLTKLVEAEVDGERLSDTEVTNFASLLLLAGHITTTLLIGNTTLCLDANPAAAERVRADRALVPTAIEESLRLLTPFALLARRTTTDVTVAGQHVPANQALMLWVGAANRDAGVFTDPNTFDPARDPNPHIAFGRGVHFCLGAPLARLEGRIVLNILLDRYRELRTDPANPPTFLRAWDMTGVSTLPLVVT